jgi:hypothetical protein
LGPSSLLRPDPVVLERLLVVVEYDLKVVPDEVVEGEVVDVEVVEGEVVVCEPEPDPPPPPERNPPAARASAAVPTTNVPARAIVRRCFIVFGAGFAEAPRSAASTSSPRAGHNALDVGSQVYSAANFWTVHAFTVSSRTRGQSSNDRWTRFGDTRLVAL